MASVMGFTDITVKRFNPSFTTLNVNIRIAKEMKVRMFIATKLLKLSAWILGMSSDISVKEVTNA